MVKITFIGAGSTIFVRRILGDAFLYPSLRYAEIALYDIDPIRLEESMTIVQDLNDRLNGGKAKVRAYAGVENRRDALRNADYVINAIQVGGYRPSTVIDFEIPKKYGMRQTIADTLGIGGIFRGLRTIPVMFDIADDMETVCPNAWLINYSNPMAILTGSLLLHRNVKVVGLCHSVQVCADTLLKNLGMRESVKNLRWKIAGINHMAWLLEIKDGKKDIYPVCRKRAEQMNQQAFADPKYKHDDMVRFEIMRAYGYYVTESSVHNAEYSPHWINNNFPELVDKFDIALDEYPRRCEEQITEWKREYEGLLNGKGGREHVETEEYAAKMMNAIELDEPIAIHGNVLNHNCITNLPANAVVEIPCMVDGNGIQKCYVGQLPPQCAALNITNINVQLMTIHATVTKDREHIYQAAMLDPRVASEMPIDKIRAMCDELITAHGNLTGMYV
jgi:alpha-galactosidase